jgi:hypothetical protein
LVAAKVSGDAGRGAQAEERPQHQLAEQHDVDDGGDALAERQR